MTKKELLAMIEKHNTLVTSGELAWLEICNSKDNCYEAIYRAMECGFISDTEAWELEELVEIGL